MAESIIAADVINYCALTRCIGVDIDSFAALNSRTITAHVSSVTFTLFISYNGQKCVTQV